ncbi:hypothetical protein CCR80_07145 [Rhodothalassium salexigens]|nr:hypothetical protein [Rhodothalassium salexigens]
MTSDRRGRMTAQQQEDVVAKRLQITGQVQGVGFRAWAQGQAGDLGVTGWVRNREDGSVEVLAKAAAGTIDRFIDLCRQGPPAARVEAVTVEGAQGIVPDRFDVKPTV